MSEHHIAFSPQFDRAVVACARAQLLIGRTAEVTARARETGASAPSIRRLAVATGQAWEGASRVNAIMEKQVVTVAHAMRAAGMEQGDASVAIRTHVRFVLYDGGLGERDTEPVVSRVDDWVREAY